jgi:Fur family transcriptional regulator, peroxide stress response regulator
MSLSANVLTPFCNQELLLTAALPAHSLALMRESHEVITAERLGRPRLGVGLGAVGERRLREALEANGQRYTEQRAAVYRHLLHTDRHPSADEVFTSVRQAIPDISLATVYKSLETLVSCKLASKLTYGDGSARYDGRTDPHPHARCLTCGMVLDLPGRLDAGALAELGELPGFAVEGYRVEVVGICASC